MQENTRSFQIRREQERIILSWRRLSENEKSSIYYQDFHEVKGEGYGVLLLVKQNSLVPTTSSSSRLEKFLAECCLGNLKVRQKLLASHGT